MCSRTASSGLLLPFKGMDKTKTTAQKKGSFRLIFMHADAVDVLLMIVGFVGAVGDGLLLPTSLLVSSKLMNKIGDVHNLSTQDVIDHINKNALMLCCIGLAQGICSFCEGYCWTRTAERQGSALRARYLKAVLRQEVGYFDLNGTSTAEVIACISNDSLVVQDFISEKLPRVVENLSKFLGACFAVFFLFWRLAIVGIPFLMLLVIPGLVFGRSLMSIARRIQQQYGKADEIVQQAISSVRTVYSFVGEAKTAAEYSAALKGPLDLGLRQGLTKGLALGRTGIIFAMWSFLSYYSSRLVMYHGAKGGTVFAVGSGLVFGGSSIGTLLSNLNYFSEANASGERIMEIIRRVPEIDSDNMEGRVLENVSGEVQFRHVEFAYPSRPESVVFNDFNLKVPAGKTVALVGESGSGKSTVIALLQRFYDPIGGEILLDGICIDKLQLKWLRSQTGLVSQEPALFATTIKENILFGKENASLEEVIEAAKASNAHNFISELPDAYDTQVGERGVQMSGGQKQRIAIARAIIGAPKLLLLDEATSALDVKSERVVQEALDKAVVGRTTIIIAHRLSTIRNADLIAVVQNGQVIEIGSHDELIEEENGLYTSLIQLQRTTTSDQLGNGTNSDDANAPTASKPVSNMSSPAKTSAPGQKASSRKISGDQAFPVPSFARLLAMSLPEWKQAIVGCVGAIFCGAVQPIYSYAMGSMISVYFLPDHGEIKKKTEIHSLSFLGLALFSILINVGQYYNLAFMGEHLTKRVREKMLSKILTFELGWFDRDENATGAICSRLAKDATLVRSLVVDRMGLLIEIISAIIISFAMGLFISWRLALVIIAVQPLIIVCMYCRKTLLKTMSKKALKSQDEGAKIAAEAVSNLRTITAFNSQIRILKMLEKAQEAPRKESIRLSWITGIGLGMSNALMRLTWALGYWYGGKLVAAGFLDPKAVFQTFLILMRMGGVIAQAGTMTNDLSKGFDAVGSVFEVLDRNSLIEPEPTSGCVPDQLKGNIEFRDVDFAYPSRPDVMVFKAFSLQIEAGKSTALVGQSGSGKSTVTGLIERFYDPLEGMLMIDNRDVKSFQLRSLRRHIGLVSQEPALFAGTIRQNIAYGGAIDIDESEIIEAARAANVHDFISGLKDGYDTQCGDKGSQLSGGQKQRIAIARAILKNPAILLLDEATSALDSQSEKVVQDALEKVMVGRTSVLVAHRLSTIQSCDMIVVLDNGQVRETGTHSSLLAKGPDGAYFSLVSLQTTLTHSS